MAQQGAADLLKIIKKDYDTWGSYVAKVGRARMETPGVAGDWSVKDIVAHITWSEAEMVEVLKTRVLAGSELWVLSQDERNEAVYQQNRERSLDDIVEEASRVHAALVEEIGKLTAEELNTDTSIKEMVPGVTLWRLLEGNTYKHYKEHSEMLAEWLEDQG